MAPSPSSHEGKCPIPYFNYPQCDLSYVDERVVVYNVLTGIQAVLFLTCALFLLRSLLRISCLRGLPCTVETYQVLLVTVGNKLPHNEPKLYVEKISSGVEPSPRSQTEKAKFSVGSPFTQPCGQGGARLLGMGLGCEATG